MSKHSMKKAKYQDPEERSGCGGALVLAVLVCGALGLLYRISPEAFLLILWGGGWTAIVVAARRVPHTPDPAPPPVPEGAETRNMQFSVVDDTTQPSHSKVVWTKRETGTSS